MRFLTQPATNRIPRWLLGARKVRMWLERPAVRPPLTAMITGSNGKTTTTNMLARILREAGHRVGKANTVGVYIDDEILWKGDASGYAGAGLVMTEPGVTAAVLETARGGLLTRGPYLTHCDVAALINIGQEHVGFAGIETPAAMAALKRTVVEAARRAVVLNADDPYCNKMLPDFPAELAIPFSWDADWIARRGHVQRGGRAIVAIPGESGQTLAVIDRQGTHPIAQLNDLPATRSGILRCNGQNAMAAAGLAVGLGIPLARIAGGLRRFQLDSIDSPGRFNLLAGYPCKILVNYGSNPIALHQTMPAIDDVDATGRRFCLVTAPDNRQRDHFDAMAKEIAGHFDRYLPYEVTRYVRTQPSGWVLSELENGLVANGVARDRIQTHASMETALTAIANKVAKDDLIVILGENLDRTLTPLNGAFGEPIPPADGDGR